MSGAIDDDRPEAGGEADAASATARTTLRLSLEGEAISASLLAYGVDARARSALRALAQMGGGATRQREWRDRLLQAHPPAPTASVDEASAHGEFTELIAGLPASGLDVGWLDRLVKCWLAIHDRGQPADLPQRMLRTLVALCHESLSATPNSHSALHTEIAIAVASASLFVSGILAETALVAAREMAQGAATDDRQSGAANHERLIELTTASLDPAHASSTGVLMAEVELAGGTRRAPPELRKALQHRAAAVMQAALRERDIVYRAGPGEFAVILSDLSNATLVSLAANKLMRALATPIAFGRREYPVRLCLGGAIAPDHGKDAVVLLRCARVALDEARQRGGRFELYSDVLARRAEELKTIEREFLQAVDRETLVLHFRPQIDVQSGRCVAVDASLRWPSENGPAVPPAMVTDLATRTGTLPRLTRWLAQHACQAYRALHDAGVDVTIGMNLPAFAVDDEELAHVVGQALDLWRVPPARLTVELAESARLSNEAQAIAVMTRLRALGCSTSIDNFGTGFSSVIHLRQLPLNELKLDQVYVRALATSEQDREIVRSLIRVAHSLKLEVVADGVDDPATLNYLRAYGCERVQGQLFGEAMPLEALVAWYKATDMHVSSV